MNLVDTVIQYVDKNLGVFLVKAGIAAIVLVLAYIVAKILARIAGKSIASRGNRGETLAPIIRTIVFFTILLVGVAMALDRVGLDASAVLAGAGVLGLAVGFGAQSLVKDCINGFFLILEDVLVVGHVVEIGAQTGTIERVGLRMTQVRLFNGQLWFIQNGDITRVGSYNHNWVRAVVEVGLSYEGDAQQGMKVAKEVADEWAEKNSELVLEPPMVQGLMSFNSSDVGIRIGIKLKPNGTQWEAERQLRAQLKEKFQKQGVEIPFPRQVVYHRQEDEAAAIRVGEK